MDGEGYSYDKKTLKKTDKSPVMETKKYFSNSVWASIKKEQDKYDRLKSEYNSAKSDFDSVSRNRREIVDKINKAVCQVRDDRGKILDYAHRYIKYLTLANSDRDVAMNFLLNAHPEVEEIDNFKEIVMREVMDMELGTGGKKAA